MLISILIFDTIQTTNDRLNKATGFVFSNMTTCPCIGTHLFTVNKYLSIYFIGSMHTHIRYGSTRLPT